ncbi:MAG: (E)-4-hydroxy-3-methylbut-2-enyl-diphosphate synthase [Tannerella sp.]|jgi:(E)-4-hydroxy-3-methylbut-2-enyl-diphosphate synthase|nr:(E)-4-hydroxy-3-methylbut-2-enyl-diphosphate synthase [Tannerella sp.]
MDFFNYKRRVRSVVQIGNTPLGGTYPVRIQSMANVPTMETDAAVSQAIRMTDAGAEYVRFTAQGEREARNLQNICRTLREKGYTTPLIADIHFQPKVADIAALYVEKVRINPGNYVDKARKFEKIKYTSRAYAAELQKIRDRFVPFLRRCRENNTAIRIGVNHGSLSDRIMSRYGDTPEGMVESCMEFLRLCAEEKFDNVVISVKASNTAVMICTIRLLVRTMDAEGMNYPLHLGVTEAGEGEDGRIKSAVGIGTLLFDGIGDTIRVSLSEEPEAEIPVARKLADYIALLKDHAPINAVASPLYDPIRPTRRKSRFVNGIGGDIPPVVISNRMNGNNSPKGILPEYRPAVITFDRTRSDDATVPDRTDSDSATDNRLMPDWIYTKPENMTDSPSAKHIVDAAYLYSDDTVNPYHIDTTYRHSGVDTGRYPQTKAYPCFSVLGKDELIKCNADTKFIKLTYNDLDDSMIQLLKTDKNTVVILSSTHTNGVGEMRAFMHRLLDTECDVPVILCREYHENDRESLQVKAAVDFGALLTDGFGDGIMLCNHESCCDTKNIENYMFGILQAARVRISKTEYISCPGCGRTLFNLQKTIAQIKSATSHMADLKIAVMGCIVNGPGEMADADYGYIGAGGGRISLYKGKECILKNIPEEDAVTRLLELINSQRQ